MADVSEVAGHIAMLAHARNERAKWAEVEDDMKAAIVEALDDDTEGAIDGLVVVRLKRTQATRVDSRKVRTNFPEVAAACITTSTTTRVDLVDTTEG